MQTYRFMEISMACTSVREMEDFWTRMFDGKVIFRGLMAGLPFSRMIVAGVTLVFREEPKLTLPPGPGVEFQYNEHLGFRVQNLDAAIADMEAKGAKFVLTPALVREWQQKTDPETGRFLQTTFIASPLTLERIQAGEYKHDVAIFVGPDNLWVELNEVREPADTQWFREATA
jgi:catechol 2,3-dioxygenase-like lactoylglutathione lyase family enzyme